MSETRIDCFTIVILPLTEFILIKKISDFKFDSTNIKN